MRIALVLLSGAGFVLGAAPLRALDVVAPGDSADATGEANRFPFFDQYPASGEWQRYQQVYAASEFGALTSPHLLTKVAFRPAVLDTFSEERTIEIRFSTTAVAPDALSIDLASNVGLDETVSLPLQSILLESAPTGTSPFDFDIEIPLATPFFYDPTLGNLLMEVYVVGVAAMGHSLNVADVLGDGVSRAFVNPTHSAADTHGLVTQFSFVPVPEPATALGVSAGLVALGAQGRHRRKR